MTGPAEPRPPAPDADAEPTRPVEQRSPSAADGPTVPTGWPSRPDSRLPGSAAAAAPRSEESRGSGWGPSAPPPATPSTSAAPAGRPPAPQGVPPRSAPLPPPRTMPLPPVGEAARPAAGTPTATVVPDNVRRPAPRPVSRPTAARGRKAKLALKRLDPWSVFVTSLLLSLLLGIATIIAAFLLYAVLSALGVPQSINSNVGDISKTPNVLTQGKFVGIAALIAGANVVLLTAMATIGAMLYNVVSTFTGGVEVTLTERD